MKPNRTKTFFVCVWFKNVTYFFAFLSSRLEKITTVLRPHTTPVICSDVFHSLIELILKNPGKVTRAIKAAPVSNRAPKSASPPAGSGLPGQPELLHSGLSNLHLSQPGCQYRKTFFFLSSPLWFRENKLEGFVPETNFHVGLILVCTAKSWCHNKAQQGAPLG